MGDFCTARLNFSNLCEFSLSLDMHRVEIAEIATLPLQCSW